MVNLRFGVTIHINTGADIKHKVMGKEWTDRPFIHLSIYDPATQNSAYVYITDPEVATKIANKLVHASEELRAGLSNLDREAEQ